MPTADIPAQDLGSHNCQDPDCPDPFDVILFRVGDSQANWLCWRHGIPFMMAVVEAVLADSAGAADGQAADVVAQTATPGV